MRNVIRAGAVATIALIVVVGAIDETRQIYTPGRTADLNDFLADGFGAAVAMIMVQAIRPAPARQLLKG